MRAKDKMFTKIGKLFKMFTKTILKFTYFFLNIINC